MTHLHTSLLMCERGWERERDGEKGGESGRESEKERGMGVGDREGKRVRGKEKVSIHMMFPGEKVLEKSHCYRQWDL